MRRLALFMALVLGFLAPQALAETELYAKTVYVHRVYPHPKGYLVMYYKNDNKTLSFLHIPREWFNRVTAESIDGSSKAELRFGNNPTIPYMQVFWKDGQFHHLKLFVNPKMDAAMWAVIPDPAKENDKFVVDADPVFDF